MIKSICFFFPSYKIGGVETLYARLSVEFIRRGYLIEIIDYKGGTLSQLLSEYKSIHVFEYSKNSTTCINSDICITSLLYLPYAKNIFSSNVRLVFWDDHPYNLILYLKHTRLIGIIGHRIFQILKRRKIKLLKELTKRVIDKKGIAFMCQSNYLLNKLYFNISAKPFYIPIPIDAKEIKFQRVLSDDVINCSYLGRLDSDKYFVCIELMNDIIKYNIQKTSKPRLVLHIIGEGNKIEMIKIIADKYPDYFKLKGKITGKSLDEYFQSNINVAFAIGTSALESAANNVPTLYMRGSNTSNRLRSKYIWINNVSNYELSLTEYELLNSNEAVISLNRVIDDVVSNSEAIALNCKSYVERKHSIDYVIRRLETIFSEGSLKLVDLQ